MTDALILLPPLEWRGIKYPITSRSVSFQHENASHKIQYRDGEYIEQTGAKDITFSYTIPMREDVARGPYKNLFTEGLVQLLLDCRNRDPETLKDPIYGEFRCVPTSYTEDSDVNKRDGTDVKVEFLHAPEFGVDVPLLHANIIGQNSLVADAGQLDAQVQVADWNQEPTPEAMTDFLSAVNGAGVTTINKINQQGAKLADLALKFEKIEQTADTAENPQNWPLRNNARSLREATVRLAARASEDPTKKVIRVTTNVGRTVSSIAADAGITVLELLRLNPILSRTPVVPSGTTIVYLKSVSAAR